MKNPHVGPYLIFSLFLPLTIFCQTFAPGVGVPGTTAMHKDSSAFVAWASGCSVTRGYQDVSNTSAGLASVGDQSLVVGKADGASVVSLGDGGSAICVFQDPITNGTGPDFAVFENGFDNTFLELAFVEVSSDGLNFFRFPATSLTDSANQTASFGTTDPTKINNLAGKYKSNYGTPFDLQELSGKAGLNINAVTHVKMIDVVGSVNKLYATYDSFGHKVNDPWPTAFGAGGFDLDAIGVINQNKTTGLNDVELVGSVSVFPNPVQVHQKLQVTSRDKISAVALMDLSGRVLASSGLDELEVPDRLEGVFFLRISTPNGLIYQKIIITK